MYKMGINKPIPIGIKYNNLTILEEGELKVYDDGKSYRTVNCQCDCGEVLYNKRLAHIKGGRIKSCGCHKWQFNGDKDTPTWQSWFAMRKRCLEKNHHAYDRYGGRGITIYDEWLNKPNGYLNFLEYMGERPEGTTLDRIDPDGNYVPGNVRWADPKTQGRNQRRFIDKEWG